MLSIILGTVMIANVTLMKILNFFIYELIPEHLFFMLSVDRIER